MNNQKYSNVLLGKIFCLRRCSSLLMTDFYLSTFSKDIKKVIRCAKINSLFLLCYFSQVFHTDLIIICEFDSNIECGFREHYRYDDEGENEKLVMRCLVSS